MTRADGVKKRKEALLAELGSQEAVSEHYRQLQKKSRENYKGTGGFAYLKKHDPERLKEIQNMGGRGGKSKKQ